MSGRVRLGEVLETLLADESPAEGIREQAQRMLESLGRQARVEVAIATRRGLEPVARLDLEAVPVPVQAMPSLAQRAGWLPAPLDVRQDCLEEVRPGTEIRAVGTGRFASVGSLQVVDGLEEVRSTRMQPVSDGASRPHLLQKLRNGMVESTRYHEFDTVIYVSDPIF